MYISIFKVSSWIFVQYTIKGHPDPNPIIIPSRSLCAKLHCNEPIRIPARHSDHQRRSRDRRTGPRAAGCREKRWKGSWTKFSEKWCWKTTTDTSLFVPFLQKSLWGSNPRRSTFPKPVSSTPKQNELPSGCPGALSLAHFSLAGAVEVMVFGRWFGCAIKLPEPEQIVLLH